MNAVRTFIVGVVAGGIGAFIASRRVNPPESKIETQTQVDEPEEEDTQLDFEYGADVDESSRVDVTHSESSASDTVSFEAGAP